MITLFWCPQTRASRVLWLLGEMDELFDVRLIDIRNPEAKQDPDFLASSPMGKVPAIMDTTPNGVVRMADSAAIALYLADRYPASGLAPAIDDPARGDYLYWMTYTPGAIEPAMMPSEMTFLRNCAVATSTGSERATKSPKLLFGSAPRARTYAVAAGVRSMSPTS